VVNHQCSWCWSATCLAIVLLWPTVVKAGPYSAPTGYYNTATGTGATLKNQLQSIMTSGHIQRSYGDFRFSAAVTDADPDVPGNILLAYNRASVSGEWNAGGRLPWNREHVWPQSLQPGSANNGTKGNLGDPHALRPADTDINGLRGHKAFGFENTTGTYRVLSGNQYFYPGDADRGDIARQLFYSTTRYASSNLSFVEGLPGSNQMGDFSSLLAYHYLDPPDDFEQRRNHAIYSSTLNPSYYTNNRNAYIDRPEYVWSVFVDQQNDSQISIAGASVNASGGSTLTLDLGRVLVGAPVPASQAVTLNKAGNDGTYFEVATTGLATSSVLGNYNAFRTGAADSTTLDIGLNTSTASAGLQSGSVTIDNLDVTTAGGTGRGSDDADDVVHVALSVLDHANPSFAAGSDLDSLVYDFGAIPMGSSAATFDFDLFNLESAASFTAGLDFDGVTTNGDVATLIVDLDRFDGPGTLEAGASANLTASFDTSVAGDFSAVYTLNFSDEDLPGASGLESLELTLLGRIDEVVADSADFDQDEDVDGIDFLTWQRGLGSGTADTNDDLLVDQLDLDIWQSQYGSDSQLVSAISIPEPTTLFLLVLTTSAALLRQRRSLC